MREILKVRTVGGSVVVTIPKTILEHVDFGPGDRVFMEVSEDGVIEITKEYTPPPREKRYTKFSVEKQEDGWINVTPKGEKS